MAERRMFAKTIIDSDAFLDMPVTSQLLYFHLSMRADDDGFINKPKTIMRICSCKDDDMKLLIAKKFIIPFETGIVVIKHWKIHNYIAKDRYKETKYKEEKASLEYDENNAYTLCIQPVYELATQDRLGKDRLGKDSIESISDSDESKPTPKKKAVKHKHGEYQHVLLTDSEIEKLIKEYGKDMTVKLIKFLDEYIEMKGYKAKNHYLAIKKWVVDAVKEREGKRKVNTGVPTGSQDDLDDFFS